MDDYRGDLDNVLQQAAVHGVTGVITIGINLSSSRAAIEIARAHPSVRATVGIHPHDSGTAGAKDTTKLGEMALENTDAVVGYGEIGLDYVKRYSDPETQRRLFRKQLRLARELGLPVIIHDREAHADCLRIIKEEGPFEAGGVMHCFSGDLDFAHRVIDCNFHISIPGIVTYRNARDMQEVATHVPIGRLLVETDGPFLAPVPYRGKRNEPCYTLYTAAKIAELRQVPLEEIARASTVNCRALFRFDVTQTNT
jgi:TatD DNase family protein